ncbi:hypothetical protein OTK49_21295 [Vibrio coralliirubri]|uniref:hypothetical protein n=1 Tax=Vibrio coralliirubri TaxID=1516159 RepID=UPI0022845462|nr:hypothetical protein [Vibrio coralliirubri]MCY9865057.1 hypothetical protein [Vibrio coralliirubri]
MTTKLKAALNSLASSSALSFNLSEKTNLLGNIEIEAHLFSNKDANGQACHAVIYFQQVSSGVSVSAKLYETYLYPETPNFDNCFKYLELAMKVVKEALESINIREEFLAYSNSKSADAELEYNSLVAKLSETHTLVDRSNVVATLDAYIAQVRQTKEQSGSKNYASKDFRMIELNKDRTKSTKSLYITLGKRISLMINSNATSKADTLARMIGLWAPKLG